MIRISDPFRCCGCSACAQRCPKRCISLREDAEGFLYPKVDVSLCIDCGLCEQVCPELHTDAEHQPLQTFAAMNPNAEVRRTSSSGGVFTALAEQVIDAGGVVFGAAFDEHWEVRHRCAETREGLAAFRGSKYVQSVIGDTFLQVERFLKSGRRVLFSGTPCQIAGLRRFLRCDYNHLLCIDFICHGVPSPGVFRAYLAEEMTKIVHKGEKKFSFAFSTIPSIPKADVLAARLGCRIDDIRFRDKTNGWKKFSFVLSLSKASATGEKIQFSALSCFTENAFMQAFLCNLILRPSCYACSCKSFRSGSDLTLGDYWGVERKAPALDDDGGTSVVFVNTENGKNILKESVIECVRCSFKECVEYNPVYKVSAQKHPKRTSFFSIVSHKKMGFNEFVARESKLPIWYRVKRKICFLAKKYESWYIDFASHI